MHGASKCDSREQNTFALQASERLNEYETSRLFILKRNNRAEATTSNSDLPFFMLGCEVTEKVVEPTSLMHFPQRLQLALCSVPFCVKPV